VAVKDSAVRTLCLVFAVSVTCAGSHAATSGAPPDRGRSIAATCANCHGTSGVSAGVTASLAGRSKQDLVDGMREYKSGARAGTIMPQLAKGYTDKQIEAASGWLSAQRQAP
jgi:cytochrome subunit of sulfide dehydrogenase